MRWIGRVFLVLVAFVVAAVGVATPASASESDARVVNNHSHLCLTPQNFSSANGAKIVQYSCGAWVTWTWDHALSWAPMRHTQYGKCLAIGGGSTAAGAALILWPCNGGYEQLWSVKPSPDGLADILVNYKSRQCLAIPHASLSPGVGAIQWPCNGGDEQKWYWA
jgi:hypothetical protein